MTRTYDLPDPNPAKLLELGIACAMPLWMERLDDKTRATWIHTRRWDRTGPKLPLEFVALVMAQASLELFEKPGEIEQPDVEGVRDYAGDYLHRVVRHGDFSDNVRELGDKLARDYSLCITIHTNVQGGSWYVLSTAEDVQTELARFVQKPILARFAECYREEYAKMDRNLRYESHLEMAFDEIVQRISRKYDNLREEMQTTA